MNVIHKLTASAEVGASDEYVMSDETVDRYGDVIKLSGWRLANFKRNPIVLFNHDNDFPIGRWEDIGVRNGALRARYVPAARGTSARIDEINSLREQRILKATSVGFKPLKAEPRANGKGVDYTDQELLECSIVSVPANPNALGVAKSMNISDDTIALVFGKQADEPVSRTMGKQAPIPPSIQSKGTRPMRLSERIIAAQDEVTQLRDQLTAHLGNEDADANVTDELSSSIEEKEAAVLTLKRAESALAAGSVPADVQRSAEPVADTRRPFAQAAKKVDPADHVFRAMAVGIVCHGHKGVSPVDVMKASYGEDQATKAVMDAVLRSATAPATTTTSGWADSLVQTAVGEFISLLMPKSVYPELAARGAKFSFGRNGVISLPARSSTPSIAGSFVGQGAPIPVRQAGFSAVSLTPKKMAVITAMTREIMEYSTPAIEGVLREAIQEDTSVAIDTILLDATAASTIRPAGLRNGVSGVTATSGANLAALVADLKALITALITGTSGNLRAPVWIMNPIQANSISMIQDGNGNFPFAAEVGQGTLRGFPIITSATVTAGTVLLIDAADFFTATGDDMRFDISDQATLHMEDTTPLAIGTAGSPNTVAAPVRSLFQTDSLALRMILPMNWALRRSGVVAWTSSVTW